MKILTTLLFLILLCTGYAFAQDSTDFPESKFDSIREYDYKMFKADADLYLQNKEYRMMEWEYRKKYLIHNYSRFRKHSAKSDIIFGMVIFIVFSGIAFSAIQFYIGLKKHRLVPVKVTNLADIGLQSTGKATPKVIDSNQQENPVTTMKVTKDGIEFSSSLLGVVILVISIVFFYLYLTIVYPIKSLEGVESKTKTESSK